jgi:hypothetical protein
MKADHDILAPSAAPRWVHCPASVPLEAQRPDQADTPANAEGKAAHHIAAEQLRALKAGVTPGFVAVAGDMTPGGVVITDEMIEAVQLFVDDVVDSVGHDCLEYLHIEEYQPIPHVHTNNGGTPDVWWAAIRPGVGAYVHVRDFKYGHRFVDAYENWQLIDYAIGIIGRGEFAGIPPERIEIELAIVQPRSYHPIGPIRFWKLTGAELLGQYFVALKDAALSAMGNNPSAVVGPWCYDCEARGGCSALQRAGDNAMDFAMSATLQDLPPEALGVELRMSERALTLLESRVAGLQAQATALIQSGQFVPGYEIQRANTREIWMKPPAEIFALGDLMGVNLRKDSAPITPSQARKAGIDEAIVAGYSGRPPGKPQLTPTNTAVTRRVFQK